MTRRTGITALLASLAILAFAGNSLLARAALADGAIEAGAFSAIRLASGALVLLPFIGRRPSRGDLPGAISLAVYVAGFSLAYLKLGAGPGALILFVCVQATILGIGYARGGRLSGAGWAGLALAMGGLIILLASGISEGSAAPLTGLGSAALMAAAGAAWGVYTVIGRGSADAVGATARNFLIASVFVAPMMLFDTGTPTMRGAALAMIAGALTSGPGYVVWYKVAPRLGLGTAASVQLATPVVAALGGAALLSEPAGWRLIAGGAMILCGIMLTLKKPQPA